MRTVLILFALALGGCQSHVQRAAGECQAAGIGVDHPAYVSCVTNSMETRRKSGEAMMGLGYQMMRDGQPRYYTPARQGFSCVQQGVFTNCY